MYIVYIYNVPKSLSNIVNNSPREIHGEDKVIEISEEDCVKNFVPNAIPVQRNISFSLSLCFSVRLSLSLFLFLSFFFSASLFLATILFQHLFLMHIFYFSFTNLSIKGTRFIG